jgi:hypothetical protein
MLSESSAIACAPVKGTVKNNDKMSSRFFIDGGKSSRIS